MRKVLISAGDLEKGD